jgi:hypothetical protein
MGISGLVGDSKSHSFHFMANLRRLTNTGRSKNACQAINESCVDVPKATGFIVMVSDQIVNFEKQGCCYYVLRCGIGI